MASSASKASLIAAATVGAMEALKDQGGLCRGNYALRSVFQHAKNSAGSFSQTKSRRMSAAASVDKLRVVRKGERASRQSEESLRKVMFLSCWGPN